MSACGKSLGDAREFRAQAMDNGHRTAMVLSTLPGARLAGGALAADVVIKTNLKVRRLRWSARDVLIRSPRGAVLTSGLGGAREPC